MEALNKFINALYWMIREAEKNPSKEDEILLVGLEKAMEIAEKIKREEEKKEKLK